MRLGGLIRSHRGCPRPFFLLSIPDVRFARDPANRRKFRPSPIVHNASD
jgi:hypothetical protein